MFQILYIFILGVLVGGFLATFQKQKKEKIEQSTEHWEQDFTSGMPEPKPPKPFRAPVGVVAKQKEQKEANMQAILGAFAWANGGKVTTDDVEKMLGVSESTAMRYLDELEKEAKIKKEMSEDRRVYYLKLS